MNRCDWCGIDLTEDFIVMENYEVFCYTCGRLEAEMPLRDGAHLGKTVTLLSERQGMYG